MLGTASKPRRGREAFLSGIAEYQAEANELANRLESDYPAAVATTLQDLATLTGTPTSYRSAPKSSVCL
jgi:hypothetical protein